MTKRQKELAIRKRISQELLKEKQEKEILEKMRRDNVLSFAQLHAPDPGPVELQPKDVDVDKKKHRFTFSEVKEKVSRTKADPVMPFLGQLEDQFENEICKLMEEINRNYHIMSRLHVLDEMIQPNAVNSNQALTNSHMEVLQNKIGQLGQLVNSLREINNEMDKVL